MTEKSGESRAAGPWPKTPESAVVSPRSEEPSHSNSFAFLTNLARLLLPFYP
jgi:hypothetical protein